jgi:hypothetical protein
MESEPEQAAVEADDLAADDVANAPSKLPPMGGMGNYGGLPPRHTLPFAIEQNVSRIATQIAEGRPATYD